MIQFSDTTNLRGLAQLYAEEIGIDNPTDLTGNTTKMKKFTARVNNAVDRYADLAVEAGGIWKVDDTNHEGDYQIIYATLTSGQKNYTWLTDEHGNVILDIYKVLILQSATATKYTELQSGDITDIKYLEENGQTGVPNEYAKKGNGLVFDVSPNYTVARGIKILINRESNRFVYTDTTKTAGYPYHQEYFYLEPAYDYARINNLAILPRLEALIYKYEGDKDRGIVGLIAEAYSRRERDTRKKITNKKILYI